MERVGIFLLHGFLGRTTDWQSVRQSLVEKLALPEHYILHAVDYFNECSLKPGSGFTEWAVAFNHYVRKHGYAENILVGYSLGGRLALHSLKHDEALWSQVVCLSCNPGIVEDREARFKNDQFWAERFLSTEDWSKLLHEWNAQPVFAGGAQEPVRNEENYSREALAQALTDWSLAKQINLTSVILGHAQKVNWIVGSKDSKFCKLAEELKRQVPALNCIVVDESSHRILWDQPERAAEIIFKIVREQQI